MPPGTAVTSQREPKMLALYMEWLLGQGGGVVSSKGKT